MKINLDEKICIYDWVSFTSKMHTVDEIKQILGMNDLDWENTKGARGYKDRQYFGSISIHYNGTPDMGVWCEMSGQGCRTYEDLGRSDYEYIFNLIIRNEKFMRLTRLDVAFDDKGEPEVLNLDVLFRDTLKQNFITKWRFYEFIGGTGGYTIYHGSPKSDVRLRIYDKAKERGYFENMHWVRSEIQLRDDRALEFVKSSGDIGVKYLGVLKNYLRYVIPSKTESNKQRWKTQPYWDNFLGTVEAISLYRKPGVEYNLFNLNRYVLKYAGASIKASIQIYGTEYFINRINDAVEIKNPRHKKVLEQSIVPTAEQFTTAGGKFLNYADIEKYKAYIENPNYIEDKNNREAEKTKTENDKNNEYYKSYWYGEMMSGRTPISFEQFLNREKGE